MKKWVRFYEPIFVIFKKGIDISLKSVIIPLVTRV